MENSTKFANSTILTNELGLQLINLTDFAANKTWTRIYQASRDGFRATDFHSKVDYYKNTLIVVKTSKSYIFGGYTTVSWDNLGFLQDNSSFIFSLVNFLNKPAKLNVTSPAHAIASLPTFGPLFGNGFDFYIATNANQTNSGTYSNLGYAYQLPFDITTSSFKARMFLAGSYNFLVAELEVYV